MNKLAMFVCSAVLMTTTAFGYFVAGTNVGKLDSLLGAANLANSSDATETTFVQSLLSNSYTIVKTTVNTGEDVPTAYVDGSTDIFAFELKYDSGYYLLKNGSCKRDDASCTNTAVFENNEQFGWGVLSLSALQDAGLFLTASQSETPNITLSHAVSFGETMISEPETLGLLALGIAGLIFARRSKQDG